MKTAIEQLIDELEKDGYAFNYEVLRIYIEKEKEQKINAYKKGIENKEVFAIGFYEWRTTTPIKSIDQYTNKESIDFYEKYLK